MFLLTGNPVASKDSWFNRVFDKSVCPPKFWMVVSVLIAPPNQSMGILNRSFSFRITGDQNVGVSDYLLQYPRPENFFSETLPYKFDNLSFFSTKEKQIFNVSKVLKLTVNFNNVNAFTGSPDFFVNKNYP